MAKVAATSLVAALMAMTLATAARPEDGALAQSFGARVTENSPGEAGTSRIYLDISAAEARLGTLPQPDGGLVVAPGQPVLIKGAAALDLAGVALSITVTPPEAEWEYDVGGGEPKCPGDEAPGAWVAGEFIEQPVEVLAATVGADGAFSATFTPRIEGEYSVEVTDPSARHRGEGTFIAGAGDFEEDCEPLPQDEIEETVAEMTQVVCDAIGIIKRRIQELPKTPAREEFERQLAEAEEVLKEGMPCGVAPAWVNGTYHLERLRKVAPEIRRAAAPVTAEVRGWVARARQARTEAPNAIAQLSSGNVVCDQLDIVANGLKFVDFYLGLIIEPAKFLGDWAKENVPTKLVSLIPSIGQTPAVKEAVELGWRGVTSYQPKLVGGKVRIGAQGFERDLAHGKVLMSGLSNYFVNRIFELFCQTFQGPVTGSMSVEISAEHGVWWTYTIRIAGQLVLRYPKGAKGDSIALTGEFYGNAAHIESWDNAVPVLFPELAQGTVFRTLRVEPIAMDTIPYVYEKNLGQATGSSTPDFNPVKSTIEQGGLIAMSVATPAFFRVPVRAELAGTKLRLELQPAAVDFDDLRVKVIHIMLPVLSLWPEVIDYALPYKGAHFILLRAMNDGPVVFDVVHDRNSMSISRDFTRNKTTPDTKGEYSLSIKACNPGC